MDRPAGTVKPIHRDMRGIVHNIILFVRSACSFFSCLFIWLVAMETFMDRKDTAVDTRGSRNKRMEPPGFQKATVGILDRSIPRNLKFSTNRFWPASPRAAWREARFSLVIIDTR